MGYREYHFSESRGDSTMIFTSDEVKSIAEWHHEWQTIGIHGNPYIVLFFTHYLMPQ